MAFGVSRETVYSAREQVRAVLEGRFEARDASGVFGTVVVDRARSWLADRLELAPHLAPYPRCQLVAIVGLLFAHGLLCFFGTLCRTALP